MAGMTKDEARLWRALDTDHRELIRFLDKALVEHHPETCSTCRLLRELSPGQLSLPLTEGPRRPR